MYVITDHDHDYYKQSVKPRFTGDFAVQTDLTMEDVEHMEPLTKETDHILRERFLDKIRVPIQSPLNIVAHTALNQKYQRRRHTAKYN